MRLLSALALITLLCAGNAAPAAGAGAKDLFYRQLKQPSVSINNGVQYWIELVRDGKCQRVSNRYEFRSGDQIRFHVRANVDGYAYVVLREGSGGEHSILFPDSRFKDNNRVKANAELSAPDGDTIEFDNNPGTEKVLLLVSRKPISPNPYMLDSFRDKVVVASARDGSKDLIPGSFVVASASDEPSASVSLSTGSSHTSVAPSETDDAGVTTVVQSDPTQVLAVDVCLTHVQNRHDEAYSKRLH